MDTRRSNHADGSDGARAAGADDAPTDRAAPADGSETTREKPPARKLGRPPLGARAKQQVTMRLNPDVIAWFRATGPGWQGRINAVLRAAAGI